MMPKLRRRSTDERTGTMTLIEHLEELRHRVVLAFIALLGGAVVGWFLYPTFINIVTRPFCDYVMSLPTDQRPPTGCDLVASGALDPFTVKLKVVFALGLFVALPVILYQLWAFIVPGLTRRERRMAVPFIASSMVLFTLGGLVAYLTLPHALDFLLGFAGDKFHEPHQRQLVHRVRRADDARVRALVRVPDPADLPGDWPACCPARSSVPGGGTRSC